jgi:hypothetical protein
VGEDGQEELFAERTEHMEKPEAVGRSPVGREARAGKKHGPKPLEPTLRRETIKVPAPELKDLICPETGREMMPGFVEKLEVLARKPAEYYVKSYERTVYVSEAKTAPVYSPWPADVLSRSRMHASVVANVAAEHYCEHVPFHRMEKKLERMGVTLSRGTMVSLMRQMNEMVYPLVVTIKADVLGSGYVMVDATAVRVQDPEHPGATREGTVWAYRGETQTVWFDYAASKSPEQPDQVLVEAKFEGLVQTDGAVKLGSIGPPGQVTSHGCLAHLRRYFFKAHQAGEQDALRWLEEINRLFHIDDLARQMKLSPNNRQLLRERRSLPVFDALVERARNGSATTLPQSLLGKALHYLLGQQESLRRTVANARVELSTNAVERAIRPLKPGAKNWMHAGHPSAGPRLANLFTVVENCRLPGIDPEAYLIDVLTNLADHPARRVDEWLPRRWKQARPDATSVAAASGEDQSR